MSITSRVLPYDEWERLPEYMDAVTMRLRPSECRMCVVEDAHGRIIAHSMLYPSLYAEDTHIEPEWRKHPAVCRALWRLMHRSAAELGHAFMVSTVFSEEARALLLHDRVRGEIIHGQQIVFPVRSQA